MCGARATAATARGGVTLVFGQLAGGALVAPGLPSEVAAFQARSAMSGAGFTTAESESVVNHPVRRRIISATMFVGTLGTPTLVVTVLLGLIAPGPGTTGTRVFVLVVGLLGLGDGFVVAAIEVRAIVDTTPRSLRGLDAALPHLRVLGVRRGEHYIGEPPADLDLAPGGQLVVHSRADGS